MVRLQHKVGWLANKPGIVHSNRTVVKNDSNYLYVAEVRESAIKPIYIKPNHVRDIKLGINAPRKNLDNYEIDWKILENEVFKLAKSIERRKTLTGKLFYYGEILFRNPSNIAKEIKQQVKQKLRNIIRFCDFSKI